MPYLTTFIGNIYSHFFPVGQYEEKFYYFLSTTNKMQPIQYSLLCQCSKCFERVFRSSSGDQKL